MIRTLAFAACLSAAPAWAWALELSLPSSARMTAERSSRLGSYALPVTAFGLEGIDVVRIEGEIRRAAWRIGSPGLTPLQVLAPLRAQLEAGGLKIALDCDQSSCGGFDFRFATEVLPAPNMYVNIRAYRFIAAYRGTLQTPEAVLSLLVSTSGNAAYVQVIQAGNLRADDTITTAGQAPSADPPLPQTTAPGVGQLIATGSLPLTELDFATGTSDLGTGPFPVLAQLAALLGDRDDIRIALVGHTDSVGGLAGNIALSKRRAQSVRQRLIDVYGVDAARLDAEGMGYLAPAASHLTAQGRTTNRRVEAIVLPAE